ncbi:MAG: cell wall hydrolase [Lachnospiraceae bacterium]|nr:cell wall hydrolase [Lachnospiraceae bacterium]
MKKRTWKRLAELLMAAILATVFAAARPVPARAETTLERLQRAKEEKEKTEEQKENAQDAKNSLQITQNSLLGELSALNDSLAQVSANLEAIESDIEAKETEIAQAQEELEKAQQTEQEQYENMKLRIKSMYENGESLTYINSLLTARSFADFLNKSDYIERVNQYDRRMLKQYEESRMEVEALQASLEEELEELQTLQDEVTDEQSKVSQLVSQTSKNVASYSDQIADAEETIDALESMINEQEEDIAALQKQYEQELAQSRLAAQSSWRDISEVTFEEGDRMLLANLIYCEAGSEPYSGQLAVGAVVINRVLSSRYPNTVVGVIYQSKQFSPVNDGHLALALASDKATASCYQAADEAMQGVTNVGQCVYFRTPIAGITGITIGGHVFY